MTTRSTRLLLLIGAFCVLMLAVAATSHAALGTTTINYGPYTIPAGSGDPHGHHEDMGMITNQLSLNVQRPCSGSACTITGMKANLVYADGTTVNWNTEAMLHHMVLMASGSGRQDAMCPSGYGGVSGSGALERIFAAGNERTPIDFTGAAYGEKLAAADQLHLVVDLMNIKTSAQTVYVQLEYKYATGTDHTARKDVRPVWLDVDGCGDSEFNAPFGLSDQTLTVSSPVTGALIGAAGHQHDHSANMQVENVNRNTDLCVSLPGFGETAGYIDTSGRKRISSMSTCLGSPAGTAAGFLTAGDLLRLHARYYAGPEHSHATEGAMGIVLGYVDTTVTPPSAAAAPAVSISSPADNSEGTSQSVSVAFATTNSPTSVTCKLDRGTPAACVSPVAYTALTEGAHTVQVAATNASGTRSKTVTFSIDKTAPVITIAEPTEGQVLTASATTVHLMISDAHPYTATCSLDGSPSTVCTPVDGHGHIELSGLANGSHTYSVTATDSMGFSSSALRNFSVNAASVPAPTVNISSPADNAYVNVTSASVAFTTTNSPASVTCKLDAGAPAACASPVAYSGLAQGVHTVIVTATNSGGSASDAVTFRVDSIAPTVTITSPTSGQRVRSRTVSIVFSVSDASPTTTTCRLNSGATSACTSPKTYTGLANGSYTVTIVATDAAGNVRTATRSFTVRP